tara:strand:- start:3817 stop:5307 length:1491 start_codon:yes stop_codon:yes gene_type:complete
MKIETKHLIDTIQLAENIYFDDYGYKINVHSYASNKPSSGNEWRTDMVVAGENTSMESISRIMDLWGGATYKTSKLFVRKYGVHMQIKAPASMIRQTHLDKSKKKTIVPVKCYMSITIPSLLELYKSEEWESFMVGEGSGDDAKDLNNYINKHLRFAELGIRVYGNWTYDDVKQNIKDGKTTHNMGKYIQPIEMNMKQVDFCINTPHVDVAQIYNLLKTGGEYGQKNLKLYHNNIDELDAEYTIGNYVGNKPVVSKVSNVIMTKANGLEFRRGARSSQIAKFYDYTRKSEKIQKERYLPIYQVMGKTKEAKHIKDFFGRTMEEIKDMKSELRYEVSIRDITGGAKGVNDLFKKHFNDIERTNITFEFLFDKRYSSIITYTLRRYLLNMFGNNITDKMTIRGNTMNKWDLLKAKEEGGEGFTKGLQVMAILQLMDAPHGLSAPEIKKRFKDLGVGYENYRRLFRMIKDNGYVLNWADDNIVAMNAIKEIYTSLERIK